jgi:hypothetical protein
LGRMDVDVDRQVPMWVKIHTLDEIETLERRIF